MCKLRPVRVKPRVRVSLLGILVAVGLEMIVDTLIPNKTLVVVGVGAVVAAVAAVVAGELVV